MANLKVNTVSGIGTEGTVFDGGLKFRSLNYMTLPKGDTTQRGRGRGIIAGGSPGADNNEQIEFITIQSDGVVTEFGELAAARRGCGGCSSSTRGLIGGGTAGNPSPSFTSTVEQIQLATTANATTFGNLNSNTRNIAGVSNATRGIFAGGGDNPTFIDVIDFFTIASAGNATDFGNLLAALKAASGVGSPTRGLFGGGQNPSFVNTIQSVTIATTGDATDFGDLTDERGPDNSQICSHLRGLFVGGENPGPTACNIIDAVTIATTGNATDFGDIRTSTSQSAGCSDSHGGLVE